MIMRPLILIPMLLFPLSACMTQRDQNVWQEFKAEVCSDRKAETAPTEAAPAAADTTETDASSEAVTPPAQVEKIQE
jgi:hypothetical protein